MSIQFQWDGQDSDILIFDLRAQWLWDEFHAAVHDGLQLMNSAPQPVYVIILSAAGFPHSPSILGEFKKVTRLFPPNLVLVVVVTDSFLVETVNQVFFKVSPLGRRIGRLAKTVEAAKLIIAEHRAKRDAAS